MRAGAIEIAMVSLTIVLIISAGCSNTSTSPGAELSPSNKDQTFNNAKSTPPPAAAEVMFRANAQHTGVYDNKEGIEPVDTYIWGFATEGIIHSSPAVANGVVYVGSCDDNLYAIDALTGKEKWRFTTGKSWVYGVLSSPAVANGVVYVGSDTTYLYAIGQRSKPR